MADDTRDQDFWHRGKVTRRRVIGYGAAAGALGATMLVPAPWQAAFGQAKPYKIGTLQPLSGAGAAGGKTALVGLQMAVDRINKIRRHQRPAGRDRDRRRRIQARRRPPQDREDARRGQDRRSCRRLPLQHLPRLHAGVRGAEGRQHDQRVPRHHADHHQVQPLQLPGSRLRAVAGGRVRARTRQDGQEVAHRLRRLFLGPVDQGRLCRADQEGGRRDRRHHRHPARHRRHDAVPVQDHRQLRRPVRHLLRQGRRDDRQPGLRSRPHQEVQVGRRRRDRRVHQSSGARQQDRRLRRHQPLHPGVGGAARHPGAQEVLRRGQGAAQPRSIRPAPIPTATCSRTTRR